MNVKRALALSAAIAALGVVGTASALANQNSDRDRDRGGFVTPCSLAGVNPAYHPEVFGSAAVPRNTASCRGRAASGTCGPIAATDANASDAIGPLRDCARGDMISAAAVGGNYSDTSVLPRVDRMRPAAGLTQ